MDLDTLIQNVADQAPSDQPLDLLATAVAHHEELTAQADQLLDYFIHGAREQDCSWAQIGEVLGVSKQAAQQRHRGVFGRIFGRSGRGGTRRLFQRFTDRARNSVVQAQVEARKLSHNYIGTEHVLLGLFADDESVAAKVLHGFNVSRDDVVREIESRIGRGDQAAKRGHLPFTPRSKKALEHALKHAHDLGHNYIGTEHVLLGLISEDEGVAAQILAGRDVTPARARDAVVTTLTSP